MHHKGAQFDIALTTRCISPPNYNVYH